MERWNLFTLTATEKEELERIRAAVERGALLPELENLCAEIAPVLTDRGFASTYAALLLAVRDRIAEAKQLFARNTTDPFCSVVREYLDRTNSFSFGFTIFADASPYRAWFESEFHKQYQPGAIENVATFVATHPPPQANGSATIVDIGTGNGILLEKIVNRIASLHHLTRIRLILNDPQPAMLQTAKEHCEKNIAIPTEIVCLEGKAQHFSAEQWCIVRQAQPVWFTNISLAIHHMPRREKLLLLQQLSTLTPHVLFAEGNWTDELPKDSPELVYITAKLYALVFEDIFASPASPEDQYAAIYQFLLPEAISILKEEIGQRTDYHMTADDWKALAEEAGFEWIRSAITTRLQGHPIAFTAEWRSTKLS